MRSARAQAGGFARILRACRVRVWLGVAAMSGKAGEELKRILHDEHGFNIVRMAKDKIAIDENDFRISKAVTTALHPIQEYVMNAETWGIRHSTDQRCRNVIFLDYDGPDMPDDFMHLMCTQRSKNGRMSYHGLVLVEGATCDWCVKFAKEYQGNGFEIFPQNRTLAMFGEYEIQEKYGGGSSSWEWCRGRGARNAVTRVAPDSLESLFKTSRGEPETPNDAHATEPAPTRLGADAGPNAKVGNRNNSALEYANHLLFTLEWGEEEVRAEMKRWNANLDEPLPEEELARTAENAISYHRKKSKENPKEAGKERKEDKELLMEFMEGEIERIVKSANDPSMIYCVVDVREVKRVMELESSEIGEWLSAAYYIKTRCMPSEELCERIPKLVKNVASLGAIPSETVYNRAALVDGVLYYDLCNDAWEVVRVTEDSVDVVKHGRGTPLFQRYPNQAAQKPPVLGSGLDCIDEMCRILRMDTLLFKVHLISLFIESIPIPIMALRGMQGSSKSTQNGQIMTIVDPSGLDVRDNLSSLPKKLEDVYLRFAKHYATAYDNVRLISKDLSDTFCKGVTGGTITARKLYTDSDEAVLRFRQKIIINGIQFNIEQGDLMERTIIYQTADIPAVERKTEKVVEEEFRDALPGFLGAVFGVLQEAIGLKDSVEESLPDRSRMADFEVWGESISRAMGHPPMEFIREYRQSMQDSNYQLMEGNLLISFLEKVLDDKDEFVDTISTFFKIIRAHAENEGCDDKSSGLPKAANRIRGYIEERRPLLASAGIDVEMFKDTTGKFKKNATLIRVRKTSKPAAAPLSKNEWSGRTV